LAVFAFFPQDRQAPPKTATVFDKLGFIVAALAALWRSSRFFPKTANLL